MTLFVYPTDKGAKCVSESLRIASSRPSGVDCERLKESGHGSEVNCRETGSSEICE